ncbi:MAG: bifunctional 4-hydroxy-2-oxoglutarate aldolase/2-dehydro-3-deoxy-phosphogluconate aldolase [Thermoflavifilum sp.]|nr:bifunctional 4-hydroxy-2-oxoglutarate aldolase/2-dehydro-3-deoxy-phosphogluconate aldolase [Thermoflavifilum sp.]
MADRQQVTAHILQQGILPLYFHADETISREVLRAIYRAGIRAVEYTNRGEAAFRNFQALIALRNQEMPDMWLGVGTIKQLREAEQYVAAGADFLVSPGYLADVATFAIQQNLLYAPGCMTPTEIMAAENQGLQLIKLFPGSLLGPEFVSSIRDIFPKLKFMPTGGVDTTRENLERWFKAGVSAVGMGSKLISKKLMEQRDYATIENLSREVLQTIHELKTAYT